MIREPRDQLQPGFLLPLGYMRRKPGNEVGTKRMASHITLFCSVVVQNVSGNIAFTLQRNKGYHEISVTAVLAFREIDRGHNAMVTFTKVMNMPPQTKNYCLL